MSLSVRDAYLTRQCNQLSSAINTLNKKINNLEEQIQPNNLNEMNKSNDSTNLILMANLSESLETTQQDVTAVSKRLSKIETMLSELFDEVSILKKLQRDPGPQGERGLQGEPGAQGERASDSETSETSETSEN